MTQRIWRVGGWINQTMVDFRIFFIFHRMWRSNYDWLWLYQLFVLQVLTKMPREKALLVSWLMEPGKLLVSQSDIQTVSLESWRSFDVFVFLTFLSNNLHSALVWLRLVDNKILHTDCKMISISSLSRDVLRCRPFNENTEYWILSSPVLILTCCCCTKTNLELDPSFYRHLVVTC